MPEEAISSGKVGSLSMTGRVEDVPLPPSLTRSRHRPGQPRQHRPGAPSM